MYRGIFLACPSSCSRRTTSSMSTVDRAGRKRHCFSGEYICVLAVVAEAGCDDFQQHLACMVNNEILP